MRAYVMNGIPLTSLRHFLLDMDGTIYLGLQPIPGAPEFIRYARDTGRRCMFLTNNPTRDAREYSAKLRGMGIEAGPEDVLTAGAATVRFLLDETPYRRVYAIGTPSFEAQLCSVGIACDAPEPEAVVLAFDTTLTYEKLERACLLVAKGLPYIATNPDKVCPTEYGYIPDCGATAALIEAATSRVPRFIGKPSPALARAAMALMSAAPHTTAMVGDRLYTDMRMAYEANITSVLVLSGETHAHDLNLANRRPDFVFASVRELHKALAASDEAAG